MLHCLLWFEAVPSLSFPDYTHYPLIRALRSLCVILCCQGWRSVAFPLHPYGNLILCEDRWESSSTLKWLWITGWHTFVSKCTNWRPFLWLSWISWDHTQVWHRMNPSLLTQLIVGLCFCSRFGYYSKHDAICQGGFSVPGTPLVILYKGGSWLHAKMVLYTFS